MPTICTMPRLPSLVTKAYTYDGAAPVVLSAHSGAIVSGVSILPVPRRLKKSRMSSRVTFSQVVLSSPQAKPDASELPELGFAG